MILRIQGLVLRYLYLYRRSPARAMEIVFWPVMDLLVWGFLSTYLRSVAVPGAVSFLIGALILWDVFYRCQQALTLAISEEVWSRNLLNLFVAPVRGVELLLATALVGVFKAAVPALLLSVLAYVCWGFDILTVGSRLGLLLFALLLFGWVAGMFTAALILRFGQAAEALVWGVPFLIQPLAAVFYPLDALPTALQPVAWLLPCAHVFEGLRAALRDGQVPTAPLVAALTLDLLYLAAAGMFFGWMLARVRDKGYLTRLGLE